MNMKMFLLRYPALILGVLSTLLQMLLAYGVPLTEGQAAAINAIAAAAFGVATAVALAHDRLLPAVLGLGQAGFALFIAFGAHITDKEVTTGLALLAAVVGGFVHTQVVAAVDQHGQRVPRRGLFSLAA